MSVPYKLIAQLHRSFINQGSKFLVGPGRKPSNPRQTTAFSRTIHTGPNSAAKVSFTLSDIGEGIREVTVKEWYVKAGDKVSQFDNICEVQSDKASVTITSRYDGVISKLYYEVDDIALVGRPLVDIETDEDEDSCSSSDEETSESVEHKHAPTEIGTNESHPVLCIPSVRRLAKEHNINLTTIKGTGKNGRILKEDILKYLDKKPEVTSTLHADRVEPIKGFQRVMVKTMTDSSKIPLFVYGDEIIVTRLSELRQSIRSLAQLQDVKLSFLPFFIKAVSNALKIHPIINASVDENCKNITYHKSHNVGIAMDTKVGLAVPVIKNVESLSIVEIAKELTRLIETGRDGTISPKDLSGGTFSISNIGAIGGTYMKPLILPPQVAIIALGTSQVLPRFDAKRNIVDEEILNISAAADHRIIDGATMAKFTQNVKEQIENPYLLFLNV